MVLTVTGSCRSAEPKTLVGVFPQIGLHLRLFFAQRPGRKESSQKQFSLAVPLAELRISGSRIIQSL
jgi:hypothetical protein